MINNISNNSSFLKQNCYFDCCEMFPLQVLAELDEDEQIVTVYLPATFSAIKAFNRFVLICCFYYSLGFIPQNM